MDDYAQDQEKVLGWDDDLDPDVDGGWVDTHHYADKSAAGGSSETGGESVSNAISEMTLEDETPRKQSVERDDSDDGM